MSDKTPHWPGADGKPGVDFGPKPLSTSKDDKRSTEETAQTPAVKKSETGQNRQGNQNRQDGQNNKALAVPGKSSKQMSRNPGQSGKSSGRGKGPAQSGKPAAVASRPAPQALPGPASQSSRPQGGKKPGPDGNQAAPAGQQPAQKGQQGQQPGKQQPGPTSLPGQSPQGGKGSAGQPASQQASGPAGGKKPQVATAAATAVAGGAAGAAAVGAGLAAKSADKAAEAAAPAAAPWTSPPAGSSNTSTPEAGSGSRDKSHRPEGSLSKAGEARRTRKARLRISRIDPWSVMKTTFLFSIAFGIMLVVIVAVLWGFVAASGALQSINSMMTQLIGDSGTQFQVEDYINAGRVIGFAAVLAALNVVIITAVATLFAFLYNLAAAVIGGLEVTLAED